MQQSTDVYSLLEDAIFQGDLKRHESGKGGDLDSWRPFRVIRALSKERANGAVRDLKVYGNLVDHSLTHFPGR